MTYSPSEQLAALLFIKLFFNPVLLLTIILPTIFWALREHLQARSWTIRWEKRGPVPDWMQYIVDGKMIPYMNFLTGFYSLVGSWIAFSGLLASLQYRAYHGVEAVVRNLPIDIATFRLLLWGSLFVSVVGFVMTIFATRSFTKDTVIEHFYNYEASRWIPLPPLNRILFARAVLVMMALALLWVELFILELGL